MAQLMDMGPVVASEYTGTYTVQRRANRTYGADGGVGSPTVTTDTIGAQVTPAAGATQEVDGAGNYRLSSWRVITEGLLRPQGATHEADRVLIDGTTGLPGATAYRVDRALPFEAAGGFTDAVVELIQP